MKRLKSLPNTLSEWLSYIEALHPKSIAMGLDRVAQVAQKLELTPNFPIITVAGTNGKGSTCAMLSAIYSQAGYRVGCYTSPHLLQYNERVRVNQTDISDADLCAAFSAVEIARGDVALTYFEMGTLAAMWYFCHANLDIAILEVGLGGRLDAVNLFEPTCSIVTNIDLDHMEYLGDTREKIGYEKAGIFRPNKLAICGETCPPESLIAHAQSIGANLQLNPRDFSAVKVESGWIYQSNQSSITLPNIGLMGDFQLNNAACALTAVLHLQTVLPVNHTQIQLAFAQVSLAGRFQTISQQPTIIIDVAHNPHAAQSLAHNLDKTPCEGRTLAVLGMLADKDIAGVMQALIPHIDIWFLADNHSVRGAKAADLSLFLTQFLPKIQVNQFSNVQLALQAACIEANKNDRIIVFGSFYTVADAMVYVARNLGLSANQNSH